MHANQCNENVHALNAQAKIKILSVIVCVYGCMGAYLCVLLSVMQFLNVATEYFVFAAFANSKPYLVLL